MLGQGRISWCGNYVLGVILSCTKVQEKQKWSNYKNNSIVWAFHNIFMCYGHLGYFPVFDLFFNNWAMNILRWVFFFSFLRRIPKSGISDS